MALIQIRGHITERGRLEVDLPAGLPTGEVQVTIEFTGTEQSFDDRPWTDDELRELLTFRPATGAEIVEAGLTGAWKDQGITDSVAWVEEVRRREQERRGW